MNSTHTITQLIEPTNRYDDGRERFITLALQANYEGVPLVKVETDGELELSISELDEHIANCQIIRARLLNAISQSS